jgi:hypothetical protein
MIFSYLWTLLDRMCGIIDPGSCIQWVLGFGIKPGMTHMGLARAQPVTWCHVGMSCIGSSGATESRRLLWHNWWPSHLAPHVHESRQSKWRNSIVPYRLAWLTLTWTQCAASSSSLSSLFLSSPSSSVLSQDHRCLLIHRYHPASLGRRSWATPVLVLPEGCSPLLIK